MENKISPGLETKKIRILLVDDHPLMLVALRHTLEHQTNFEVIGEAEDGEAAVKLTAELKPDIVIMDISMPKLNGLEATKIIKTKYPETGVLILTVHTDNEHVLNILQVGADGYLTKKASTAEVISAINSLAAGNQVLSSQVSKQIYKYVFEYVSKPSSSETIDGLNAREMELLKLIARGLGNKDIATKLNLSIHTIKSYITDLFLKLHVTSRMEAVIVGLRKGILSSEDIE